MLQKDIEVGGIYHVRWHDGSFTDVKVTGTRPAYQFSGQRARVQYGAINLKTGRPVVIKSAAKFRARVG